MIDVVDHVQLPTFNWYDYWILWLGESMILSRPAIFFVVDSESSYHEE